MTLEQPAMDKQMTAKSEILKKLFFSTFYLSAFTFGGGYVIITLLKQKFVDELHWISEDEMLDLVALAQSSPGPIAVNGAILVGYKLAGIPGVLTSVLGAVIPPFVILTLISSFYTVFKSNLIIKTLLTGMKAGVAAVIMSVVFDMMTDDGSHKIQRSRARYCDDRCLSGKLCFPYQRSLYNSLDGSFRCFQNCSDAEKHRS